MFATAPATDRPARSSPGKGTTRTTRPAVADGSSSAPQAALSATSTSTMPTIQASCANATDFFNSLLEADIPAGKLVHAILDNYAAHKTPQVRRWLAAHPRWTFHFTPTS